GIRRLLFICAMALAWTTAAAAQTYPTKPVRIIVPFPAGQATDILARVIGEQLAKTLGQPVVIENKPGAGGTIGATLAAKSEPDGHTPLRATTPPHGIGPTLYAKLPYDPLRDFARISSVGLTPQTLMASKKTDMTSLKDVIAKAKAGEVDFGSSGNGSASHLAAEMLKATAGLQLRHIPFKGNSDAFVALARGDIAVLFDAIPGALPQVTGGGGRGI